MSETPQVRRRWLRLCLLALFGLTSTVAIICWLCAAWPVTTYQLERVAEGPYALGHFGNAWIPHERPPSKEEISNRIVVCLARLVICAVVGVFFFDRWSSRRPVPAILKLANWNLAGLEDPGRVAPGLNGAKSLPTSRTPTDA